jgi:hypothetical protein
MVSHPGKSTNPFDMAFESDVDANDMVLLFFFLTYNSIKNNAG